MEVVVDPLAAPVRGGAPDAEDAQGSAVSRG